jgi:RNAse (barnase) inhibitor barstar
MRTVNIDGTKLTDWNAFHAYFKEAFGFPDYYGNNMNAWIDCMSDEDGLIVLHFSNIETLKHSAPDIYNAIIECSAFVNYRCVEGGSQPIIILSFYN